MARLDSRSSASYPTCPPALRSNPLCLFLALLALVSLSWQLAGADAADPCNADAAVLLTNSASIDGPSTGVTRVLLVVLRTLLY
ncbi:hypothetical protein NUW54_g1117 [Trametes sanguinea]|uniref:Uncharacterized protein n=1 Tax=Trametes sanguinea TaxID=158606 RepID=A0ACC1QB03_9APHY|nr:hypothetical protein NUW54_g1117 [Trametes sanguinea]